jgi:hypothetical protein
VSKATLSYYGKNISQCTIAEYARTHATWHNFGSVDCCQDASKGCNYSNYNYGAEGSIQKILQNWGVNNIGRGYALSQTDVSAEIENNRPFIIRWGWSTGGGHFLVGHGIENGMLHYMNPWPGEGLKTSMYDWVVSGETHTWTHTNSAALTPQSGWWWNAAEPGRGYFIEAKNGRFYLASYLYDSSGNALWYVTGPGNVSGNTLPGTLSTYSGGQTLTGAYKSPTGPNSAGSMSVTFSDSTHGTIIWPGGSVPITRYELATGSLSLPDPSFKPETGWWWNASEGGRGFSIEVQGDNLFIGGFMYDGSGNPVWYVSAGKMSTPTVYQGNWMQYGNGQSMGGVFKAAAVKNNNVGGIAISFTSTTTATMYLPDGRTIPLTRYSF